MAKALRLTQVERKEISDAKMLEAAIDLIVERGTDQATLKDVGERAGFSRGLAGYRFGNKAGLFDFVLRSVGDEWLGELTAVTRGKYGYEAMAAALDAHIAFCEEAPKHVEAFYRLWFESLSPNSPFSRLSLVFMSAVAPMLSVGLSRLLPPVLRLTRCLQSYWQINTVPRLLALSITGLVIRVISMICAPVTMA